MKKSFFCLFFVVVFCTFASAQKEFVQLRSRGAKPIRVFTYHQQSNFEIVNGKFNASLASSNGYLLEINGISVKQLKCDGRLNAKQFKVVLIDNSMNRTYASNENSKGILTIRCLPGGEYELYYTGEIYRDKLKVVVNATLVGSINRSRNLKTTK